MIPEFHPNFVLLSYGIAFIGVYVAVSATEQLRGVFLKYHNPTNLQKFPWLILNGICVGIIAFWGMHYVAFSGMIIKDDKGNIVPITFNPIISIFSLLVGFIFQVIGVYTACNDRFYAKSKSEILDFLIQHYNIEEILLSYNELYITYLLISKELIHCIFGGISAGIGIIGVYFIGLTSIQFPGYITYNGGILFAALFIGFSAAIIAYWLFFRLLSILPNIELIRIAVAVSGGIAICGIFYIAMLGTNFHIDYSRSTEVSWKTTSMTTDDSLYPVLLGSMVMLWLITMIIFADLRIKINAYRSYLQKLSPNETLSNLLIKAENSLNTEVSSERTEQKKKNTIAPLPFNDDESPL